MKRTFIVSMVALMGFGVAFGAADSMKEASKLMDQATADWRAGKYEAAAEKLDRASRVWLAAGPKQYRNWAICERAMTWNYVDAGDKTKAIHTFANMLKVLKGRSDLSDQLQSALGAIYHLALGASSPKKVRSIVAPCVNAAEVAGFDPLAAQLLHDEGYCVASKGDVDGGIALLRQAAVLRQQLDDLLGQTWSYNNICYWELKEGRAVAGAKALVHAYKAVYGQRVLPPQRYVSVNLKTLLAKYDSSHDAKLRPYLWQIVDAGASSTVPRIVPVDAVARRLVATDPLRVAKLEIHGALPEATADLKIRAARVLIDDGKTSAARRLLAGLDTGNGPAASMLKARAETAVALADAGEAEVEPFLNAANEAAARWRNLKDRAGRQAALHDFAGAVKRLKIEGRGKAIVDAYEKLVRSGAPGGAGASSSAGGDLSGYKKLGPQDPLFTIALDNKGEVVITDLVTRQKMKCSVRWSPRDECLNGVSFKLFGGYVAVTTFAYGGASLSTGAPGTMTLDQMGEYRPLPAKGELVILKNGAVTYRAK